MFGLFKNKEKEDENNLNHPEFLALVEKWDGFLQKIETRFNESLVNAEEALFENLVDSDYDINPTITAWQGIKSQLMGLADKVDTTFDNTVKPQMQDYVEDWNLIDENQKGTQLRESIFERIERYQIVLEGKISKRFYNHAIHFLNEDFNCTQCSATLEIKKDIFRSHYVSCNYCNTVNTFTPNDKIAQIAWVVTNIANHNAIEKWDAMQKAIEEYNALRSWREGEDFTKHKLALHKREHTERAYWEKRFTERFKLLPEFEATFEHDVDVKMRHFYEFRKREFNF